MQLFEILNDLRAKPYPPEGSDPGTDHPGGKAPPGDPISTAAEVDLGVPSSGSLPTHRARSIPRAPLYTCPPPPKKNPYCGSEKAHSAARADGFVAGAASPLNLYGSWQMKHPW